MKKRRRRLSKRIAAVSLKAGSAGFTLIEMMIAMVIASILLSAVYTVYVSLSRSYTTQDVSAEVQQSIRATIDYMAEDIMMAGLDPRSSGQFGFENSGSSLISFRLDRPESDNTFSGSYESGREEWITYKYDSALGVVCQCFDSNDCDCSNTSNQFIDNVTAFTLNYLNASDQDLINDLGYSDPLTGTDRGDIRQVAVTISVQEPAGAAGTVDRTYSTRVRCRNAGL